MNITLVEASSVSDFLNRYYKPDRRTKTLLTTYETDYHNNGYVSTSHHDNLTGAFIFWPFLPQWAEQLVDTDTAQRSKELRSEFQPPANKREHKFYPGFGPSRSMLSADEIIKRLTV